MYRSTTPVIIIEIDNEEPEFNMDMINKCHLTIESLDGLHKIKYESPIIDRENHQIRQMMTQSETKMFNVGKVKVQLKVRFTNGSIVPSEMMVSTINEILEEEEM